MGTNMLATFMAAMDAFAGAPTHALSTQDFEGALTALITGVLAIVAISQLRRTAFTARADFLFKLGETAQKYGDLHNKLVVGDWAATSDADTQEMRRYIGLFEVVQVFLERGALDLASVDWVLGHRVFRLANNGVIRQTILAEAQEKHWLKFFALQQSLRRRRGAYHRLERDAFEEVRKLVHKLNDGDASAKGELFANYYDVLRSRYPDIIEKFEGMPPASAGAGAPAI
jgi:hypothetical protein